MSKWNNHGNNHGLPFFPGFTFWDVTKSAFHRPQTLGYKNGFPLPTRPIMGIGQEPLPSAQIILHDNTDMFAEIPHLTYGPTDQTIYTGFIPAHVALDKKVLRYYAYFVEDILNSPQEVYRVRPVVIYYYLEDDSMSIFEPRRENSGIPQGGRIKRQRLPKNEHGEHYQWRDLNVAMDLKMYGVKYRITDCDDFTKGFMEREGLVINEPEPMPVDPYSKHRQISQPTHMTPPQFDRVFQFLTMDRKVLRFFGLWNDDKSETRRVSIQYYLVDDTVEIREVHKPNSGRDPLPVLMRRQRLPKKIKPKNFPSCVLEISLAEVDEYYSPKDFQLGQIVTLLGRHFKLYDCDAFTKEYYQKNHPDMEMKSAEPPEKVVVPQTKAIPPYNGFGSVEDSLQNCLSLVPEPHKIDVLKFLENNNKVLHYSVVLDSQYPQDEGRRFILSYCLADDMISIFEKPAKNSGIIPGKFLKKTRVPKPGSSVENPEFYSPADFAIGAMIEVFSRRFVVVDADYYVLTYLESISNQIPSQTLDSLRQKMGVMIANNQPADQNGEAA